MTLKFQARVNEWLLACFGLQITRDKTERNHRFLEEALELVQSTGCTSSEAHQLVDYVFNRPVGEPHQELGGVMVTLAALSQANDLDMDGAGETELSRVWDKMDLIRAKQKAKPKHSPLPVTAVNLTANEAVELPAVPKSPAAIDGSLLYQRAVRLVRSTGKASTSWVQRRLIIPYKKAEVIVGEMQRNGVISAADEHGVRQVLSEGTKVTP